MKQTILIIDDDFGIRDSMKEVLESEGYNVLLARNGLEGLRVLEKHKKVNLVLLDLSMPIMTGEEFMSHISKDTVLASTRVLIVSAVADKVSNLGAMEFIKKPIDIDVLLLLVEKYCVA